MVDFESVVEMEKALDSLLHEFYEEEPEQESDLPYHAESPIAVRNNSVAVVSTSSSITSSNATAAANPAATGDDYKDLQNEIPRYSESRVQTVKETIDSDPSFLSVTDHEGYLPIHSAAWCVKTCRYVRLLAEEGIKRNVGGRGSRGGLLVHIEDPFLRNRGQNVLQSLANLKCGEEDKANQLDEHCFDAMYLTALEDLRQSNLLLTEDIREQELLYWSCHPDAQMRFEYLVALDADALKYSSYRGESLVHAIISNPRRKICSFGIALKAGLKHHGSEFVLELLFQKGNDGQSVCTRAFHKYGVEQTFHIIKQCISTDSEMPVLHYAMGHNQAIFQEFALRYPDAAFVRDKKGRTLIQYAIASGSKTYKTDAFYFARIRSDELEERDPSTNLYPFMTAAVAETSNDLSTIFYLLGRNPAMAIPLE